MKALVELIGVLLVWWLIASIVLPSKSHPHESAEGWTYPAGCCGMQDCRPVPCDELTEGNEGWWHWQKYSFHPAQVRPSQDKFCHVCVAGATARCAFILNGV